MTRPSTPGSKRQKHQPHGNDGRENPTNVRNGNDLIARTFDGLLNERCRTALIQPQGQMFFMACQQRTHRSFNVHVPLIGSGAGDCNRWLARSLAGDRERFSYSPHIPPNPQSTARCQIGPEVAKVMHEILNGASATDQGSQSTDVVYLMVFEGASGMAVQKFFLAYTAGEASSMMFHHLANGLPVAFICIVLTESYDQKEGLYHRWGGKNYSVCKTIDQMRMVSVDSELDFSEKGKKTIGIVY